MGMIPLVFRGVAAAVMVGAAGIALGTEGAGTQGGAATTHAELPRQQYWFGVAVENSPPPFARQLKLAPDQGLMVMAVLRDSPAQRAELKPDDLLIEVDGEPLTSQEQLARIANATEGRGDKEKPRLAHLTLLRAGDRITLEITAAPRPTSMMAVGGSIGSFLSHGREGNSTAMVAVKNYVLPNGTAAQVGPGYRIDLNGPRATALSDVSIRQIVSKGQTLILSQEQDGTGAVKMSITVGGKTYPVDAGKLDALPAELRPIADRLLAVGSAAHVATNPAPVATVGCGQLLKVLENKNEQLQQEVSELLRLMREKTNK